MKTFSFSVWWPASSVHPSPGWFTRLLCSPSAPRSQSQFNMEKALRDANTARGAKKFRPAADPLPGGAGRTKFNQLEMVTTFTYKPSLVRIDARNFELSW